MVRILVSGYFMAVLGNGQIQMLIGGWVKPRAGMNTGEYGRISCNCQELNPGRPDCSHSLYRLSYPGSLVLSTYYSINYLVMIHVV
jgi:hypothetical protein